MQYSRTLFFLEIYWTLEHWASSWWFFSWSWIHIFVFSYLVFKYVCRLGNVTEWKNCEGSQFVNKLKVRNVWILLHSPHSSDLNINARSVFSNSFSSTFMLFLYVTVRLQIFLSVKNTQLVSFPCVYELNQREELSVEQAVQVSVTVWAMRLTLFELAPRGFLISIGNTKIWLKGRQTNHTPVCLKTLFPSSSTNLFWYWSK